MARALQSDRLSPADELRALLTDSEKLLANIRGLGADALRFFKQMDRIAELWPELEALGMDLRPEAGRWATLQAKTHARARAILHELRAAGRLSELRDQAAAPAGANAGGQPAAAATAPSDASRDSFAASHWWWYLDREVRERNRTRAIRLGAALVVAVIAVAGGLFLFRHFFPVDPKVAAASEDLSNGQQKIDNTRDYVGALADFQAAAAQTPDEPEVWLWIGATQQKLGQDPTAALNRAHALSGSDLNYYLGRASIFTELQFYDQARADLNAALKIDPQNAQAYYYLANIEEAQGNLSEAADALDKASNYADARKQTELVAMSRVRLGLLLQRMQSQQSDTTTPAPQ